MLFVQPQWKAVYLPCEPAIPQNTKALIQKETNMPLLVIANTWRES